MIGPACVERSRNATPAAQSVPIRLTSSPRITSVKSSSGLPKISIPISRPIANTTTVLKNQRTIVAIA